MTSSILFSEKQRFTQWWLWLILSLLNGSFIFGVIWQVVLGHPFGDKPASNSGLLIIAGSMASISLMFLFTQLQTNITEEGIYVRLSPFHVRFKHFKWQDLEKVYVRQYSSISEYGGWGLRYSITGSGKAYNISGNIGLQLEFKNGKKLLIGTKKADELNSVLENLGI